MKLVFADTFYFIALLSPTDRAAAKAQAFVATEHERLVTSYWVLLEVGNALARSRTRNSFVTTLDALRLADNVDIAPASDELFNRGVDLYRARLDKDWSLTDCISFDIMNERGITDALTADHHFEQAGFRALLK